MRFRILCALAAGTLTAGCFFTERSNPYELQPYAVSCKQCPTNGLGCSLYAFRGVGSDDVYYATGLPFLGDIVPTTIATSVATRLDVPRSRVVEGAVPRACQVPSTILMGAPADGPLGGTGRMVVVYSSGDQYRTQPYCVPSGLP